jgi:glycosyltransferase involved in cell wall biosynthesis
VETHLGWRQARCVFATTPQTLTDVVSYAGVRRDRALLAPTLVDPIGGAPPPSPAGPGKDEPYILWITNTSAHKNHRAAVEALRSYYGELGGTLPVVVAGTHSNLLAPGSGADYPSCRVVREARDVLPHLRFAGEVTDAAYLRLVSGAALVWHNVIADNGTFVAFDAARAGRHLVSSDYPQMRYLCERYGVVALWHPAGDPRAAALALVEAERRAAAGADPGHALRQDSDDERHAAYGTLLATLLGKDHA